MFKKNNSKNTENNESKKDSKDNNTLQSWLTGKVGSFILFTGVGYAIYKFGIINKITNYFKPKEKSPNN